jgi:transposase-like protein
MGSKGYSVEFKAEAVQQVNERGYPVADVTDTEP